MFLEENKILEKILIRKKILKSNKYEVDSLVGGVSSDIWKINHDNKIICIKKSKKKLKVKQNWQAPVIRNMFEAFWNEEVYKFMPSIVPKVLYKNKKPYFFVMEYFDEQLYPIWKTKLLNNEIDYKFAISVSKYLNMIHNHFYNKASVFRKFDNMKIFEELRIKPYIKNLISNHKDLKNELESVSKSLSEKKITLIHGDISPKNILIKKNKPIFLDAECATYGDPAFDFAFCLNHLILKKIILKNSNRLLKKSYDNFIKIYLSNIKWENPSSFEKRVAKILPILILARIDGKSPVEYITSEKEKKTVRMFARNFIINPVNSLNTLSEKWFN